MTSRTVIMEDSLKSFWKWAWAFSILVGTNRYLCIAIISNANTDFVFIITHLLSYTDQNSLRL